MKKVVIVIPIHKADPTHNEIASFVQCYKILGAHPIRIVAPEGLDVTEYRNAVPYCEFLFIDPHWLSSVEQYNKLKISLYFYNLFKDYEYLLTYELDAWVFRDELLYWCDKGYDYIGAPWFEGYSTGNSIDFLEGGNSGFSLRNVQKAIISLKRVKRVRKFRNSWYRSRLQAVVRSESLFKLYFGTSALHIRKYMTLDFFGVHEDYFWSRVIPGHFTDFRVAQSQDAIPFSFEVRPSVLYEANQKKLPFGCHAWEKYEPKFWEQFIDA